MKRVGPVSYSFVDESSELISSLSTLLVSPIIPLSHKIDSCKECEAENNRV